MKRMLSVLPFNEREWTRKTKVTFTCQLTLESIDLVTVFELQCLYVNLVSNNFCRTAVLKKKEEFFCAFALKCLKSVQTPIFPQFFVLCMCADALWSLILSSTFCPFLYTAPFTTHESGFARTSWLTTHPFNTPWSATPLTGGSRDTSCGIHRTLSWGRRDDRDSVGVIGAGVIGADQVGALQLFFFYIFRKELTRRTLKGKQKLTFELQSGK